MGANRIPLLWVDKEKQAAAPQRENNQWQIN